MKGGEGGREHKSRGKNGVTKIFTTLVIPFSRRGNDGAKFLIERIVFPWVDRDEVVFI